MSAELAVDRSADQEAAPANWVLRIAILLGILFLLYIVAFGPFMYVLVKWSIGPDGSVMRTICYPHLALTYHSKTYYKYIGWWVTLAEPGAMMISHAEYRKWFEDGY